MKPLNKFQQLLYCLGGILMLVGVVMNPFHHTAFPPSAGPAPYIYSVGALLFASMQVLSRYEGTNFVIRRLRRQQIIGAVLLVFSGAAMFANVYGVTCLRHNEWLVILAIAALLELYTAFRIPQELKKEDKNAR